MKPIAQKRIQRLVLARRLLKWVIAPILITAFAYPLSRLFVQAEGPDRTVYRPIHLETEERLTWGPRTVWSKKPHKGRPMDPETRVLLTRGYEAAWRRLSEAKRAAEDTALDRLFTDGALTQVRKAVETARKSDVLIEEVSTDHWLQLDLFSADGRTAILHDQGHRRRYLARHRTTGTVLAEGEDVSAFDVAMRLEDGDFRVSHIVRTGDGERLSAEEAREDALRSLKSRNSLEPHPTEVSFTEPPMIRFPTNQFEVSTFDHEVAKAAAREVKGVRLMVPFADAGGGSVSESTLQQFQETLESLSKNGMRATVALLSDRRNDDLGHWPEADRHVEAFVSKGRSHPAIVGWEIVRARPQQGWNASDAGRFSAFLLERGVMYDPVHPILIKELNGGS